MTNKEINEMIDHEFDEFEHDRSRRKNIKAFLKLKSSVYDFTETKLTMTDPKFKKKLNTSVYIKHKNKNNNQLF